MGVTQVADIHWLHCIHVRMDRQSTSSLKEITAQADRDSDRHRLLFAGGRWERYLGLEQG